MQTYKRIQQDILSKLKNSWHSSINYVGLQQNGSVGQDEEQCPEDAGTTCLEKSQKNHQMVTQGKVINNLPLRHSGTEAQHEVPPASPPPCSNKHLLSTKQLVGITFFAVAGGPFGFEEIVGAGGPRLMMVGLLLFPFLWTAPLALMTAEMSCMIPESGGHVLWVYRAFGPFWSFVNSSFAFACSVLDNAMYPTLFIGYLSNLIYEGNYNIHYGSSVFLKMLLLLATTAINIFGVDLTGNVSILLALMVLAPFLILCVIGIFYLNFEWMDLHVSDKVDWGKFISLLLWNTSGFDVASTCASEVRNPGHSYPQALIINFLLLVAVYGLPALIGISVIPNPTKWITGTYVNVAKTIGGRFLGGWMGFAGTLSALGLLLTRLCTNSRIVYGMAQVEHLPAKLTSLHPIYATPWIAIMATSFCTLVFCFFNFYHLAEVNAVIIKADMLFYALSTILKFSALVKLRFIEPDVFRPFQIPFQDRTLAGLTLIPLLMCVAMIFFASERSHAIGLIGASLAIFGYIVKELFAQHGMEEAVQQRIARVQQNIDKMQHRIDMVIGKEFKEPFEQLGQAMLQTSSTRRHQR